MRAQRLESCFNLGAIWWLPCLGHLTSGIESWYPLYRRQGGPQGHCEWVQKILCPPGFDSWTVQPIASCCTDYAILAHNIVWEVLFAFYVIFIQLIRNFGVCWEFILIVHSVLLLQAQAWLTTYNMSYLGTMWIFIEPLRQKCWIHPSNWARKDIRQLVEG